MIISEINGGLGNQMFQYACGRALSIVNNDEYKLDTTTLMKGGTDEHFTARPFELSIFKAPIHIAGSTELCKFFPKLIPFKVLYKWIWKHKIFVEPYFDYSNNIEQKKGNIYLRGYWQTEKYFKTVQNQIIKDFSFNKETNAKTKLFSNLIKNEPAAVSIHIRRGDYVTSPSANSFHGLQGLDYYDEAMKLVQEKIANPTYFVFSDDPAWVKEHLTKDNGNMHVVEHNKNADSWQDMFLMSQCSHHIIANSSFSWWGAWLNENVDKMVIAPKKWFIDKSLNDKTQDLIPTNWRRI